MTSYVITIEHSYGYASMFTGKVLDTDRGYREVESMYVRSKKAVEEWAKTKSIAYAAPIRKKSGNCLSVYNF